MESPPLFGSTLFFGAFQAALLYPLNVPYLLLPLGISINLDIILHVLLLGFFMYLWAIQHDLILGTAVSIISSLIYVGLLIFTIARYHRRKSITISR